MKKLVIYSLIAAFIIIAVAFISFLPQQKTVTLLGEFIPECAGEPPYAQECGIKPIMKVDISGNNTKWKFYSLTNLNDFSINIKRGANIRVEGIPSGVIDKTYLTEDIHILDITIIE